MMKSWVPYLGMVFLTASTSGFASDSIRCDRISDSGKGEKVLKIEITKNTILTTPRGFFGDANSGVWERDDPGLYSYWGTDASEINKTNEQTIYHLRLDIEKSAKKLSDVRRGVPFEMEIQFIWESRYFGSSGVISSDMYSCR